MQEWLFGNGGMQIVALIKQYPWQLIFALSVGILLIQLMFGKWSWSGSGDGGDFSGIFGDGDSGDCGGD